MCGGNADPAALGRRVGKELKETMEAGRKCWRATSANGAESLVEVTVGIVNCEGRWATQKIQLLACLLWRVCSKLESFFKRQFLPAYVITGCQ